MGLLSGKRPSDLGLKNAKLKAAPPSPNAVNSQASDGCHQIAPLRFKGTPEQAMKTLKAIIEPTPNTCIIDMQADYIYAEYASALLGFVDDVEFYFPPGGSIIHVRSASRLGHSDLGANRKRIEGIRARLAQAGV